MSKINLLASLLFVLIASTALAQDLTDDVCLECHADTERSEPRRVHNADGSLIQEGHQMWLCVDCHDYIMKVPHALLMLDEWGDKELEVDCLNCHDEVPLTD